MYLSIKHHWETSCCTRTGKLTGNNDEDNGSRCTINNEILLDVPRLTYKFCSIIQADWYLCIMLSNPI